jgi:hypothetical protein
MKRTLLIAMLVLALLNPKGLADPLGLAHAQTGGGYELTWSTIDGGGAMNATGGAYTLGGTMGQPDAGAAMTGGGYTLVGGFWHDWGAQFEVFLPLILR